MAAGNDHVILARISSNAYPFFGFKLEGVELFFRLFIFGNGNAFIMHTPFLPSQDRIQAPMDEHAKSDILIPLQAFCRDLLRHFSLSFRWIKMNRKSLAHRN